MLRFIVRRVLQMIGVLFVLSILLFAWTRSLPGGPVDAICGERCNDEQRAALRAQLGLDKSVFQQYLTFLGNAFQGRFGTSTGVLPGTDAMDLFLRRLPATLELSVTAIFIAVLFGVPLGYLAARRRGGIFDNMSIIGSLVGVAVPVFFLAFVLKYFFAIDNQILPLQGRQGDINATRVTGFFVLDGILTREWDAAWNAIQHLILPSIALATIPFAVIFRITRAAVLDVLDEDYVRTAEAKGLTARTIRWRHVLRNALLPVTTTLGLQIGALLGGAVLTERVFVWGGIGESLASAIQLRDYAVIQVFILMAAAGYVVVNLLVDIGYAIIDPRVRTR
ncbi:peptide/nickel transport system permease protein [Barrientosiimonas humi]|uniref:Peptide/nickel transport system permease protein n=2 Tax=Barrientosiimonas TaxID=1535207 RepID=A0A542X945_9MICO|nr:MULTISPECIES: ABC transporter permease [Barrientosiimonas]TQL32330.1 peptide/nickel transport system permease protein [Barrientosiimonas humi]BDZ57078.1 peptide ABC transporter permease [Barrientosiimonas endolithica]CAG7572318.1 Dipeptide transport system permease protein DppB [Barrientosiimonas humi]